jgi:hypothetical protein
MHTKLIQLVLSGFGGTTWDGILGNKTIQQIKQFQKDYMDDKVPDGIVGPITESAIKDFIKMYPLDFESLKCPNCSCGGFGEKGGIHVALLCTLKAIKFYTGELKITSGYRCELNNKKHGRKTTNHMGNAVDFYNVKKDHRKVIIDKCNCQEGWSIKNKKSVEPGILTPTWVHIDLKTYDSSYKTHNYYINNEEKLWTLIIVNNV